VTLGVGRRQRWFLLGNDDDDDTDGCVGDAPGRLGLWLVDVWLGTWATPQITNAAKPFSGAACTRVPDLHGYMPHGPSSTRTRRKFFLPDRCLGCTIS
jgi:hypothetical protein